MLSTAQSKSKQNRILLADSVLIHHSSYKKSIHSLELLEEESDKMSKDTAPLLNSQDSNFDEDDYLSEGNRKTYGINGGGGSGRKKETNCCGKCIWCLCGGCFQACGRYG